MLHIVIRATRNAHLARALSVVSVARVNGAKGDGGSSTRPGLPTALLIGAAVSCTLGLSTALAEEAKDAPSEVQKAYQPLTNNPMEYEPITNEYTAQMTMARAAALEHYQAGRYPQAETKLIEALDCAKLGFEATDPHLASCMNNLAEFYRNMGQYDKAEGLYHEALDLLESIFGERHWLYVSAMHNLALMLEARGELEKALETMKQVVKLRLVMFGPLHFLYADSIFALAHIYNKLASKSRAEAAAAVATTASSSSTGGGAEKKAPADAAAQVKGSGWWGWIRFRRGGAKKPGDEEAKEAVALMAKAIGIMEEAETVQVNVVLYWLVELAEEHKRQGNMNPAVECMRKALHHFGSDKGEAMAQASQLSDRLVDFLLEGGRQADARTAMQACVSGRTATFGRELVVAQSMLRLATIEAGIKKAETDASALQNAANAAALAQELMTEYSKPTVSNWMGSAGSDKSLKRVQAGNVCGSAFKFVAALQKRMGSVADSETALKNAVDVYEGSCEAVKAQFKLLKASSSKPGASSVPTALVEEVSSLFVELHISLMDCLEQLAELVESRGQAGKATELLQRAESIAEEILKMHE